jgi:formylglycine-generating enzyme
MKSPLIFLAALALPTSAVTIDYVTIGNVANAADPADGDQFTSGIQNYGSVAYVYKIAKNETTISQYAEFLNAVAKTDTYGLYSTGMTISYINGISRSGTSGSYTYTVNPGSENKPITYVSWLDAARFCNWLHHGQPTGDLGVGLIEDGAYSLLGATSGIITKNAGAKTWIPSENEWYKAAYYDPTKGGSGGYWLHANQRNTMTTNDFGVAGAANHVDANGYATLTGGTSWSITDVGAYGANSDSYYGTNDQAGNVWEWNDAVISGSSRGLRGGSWGNSEPGLRSSNRFDSGSSVQGDTFGFRVASVPEPSAMVLTILFSAALFTRRKR